MTTTTPNRSWERWQRMLHNVETWVSVALLVFLTLILLAQVVSRYVFDQPLGWSDELARFTFVWLVFIGAAAMASENRHIAVTYFTDKLPPRLHTWAVRLAAAIFMVAAGVTAFKAVSFVQAVWPLNSPANGISMGIVYAASAVGFTLMALHMVPYVVTGETHEETLDEMLEAAT